MEGKADARAGATVDGLIARMGALRAEHLKGPERRSVTAISAQTAALLWSEMAQLPDGATVIELGMGFSSWVLRTFQAECGGVTVHSFDGDDRWRALTVSELSERGLPHEPNGLLHDWRQMSDGVADLLFVDHGKASDRVVDLPRVVRQLKPSGVIVLDDWQFEDVALAMGALLRDQGFAVEPRRDLVDAHNRFPAVARQRGNVP